MKNVLKLSILIILICLLFCACSVVDRNTLEFKGKTESEWQITINKDLQHQLEKTSSIDESIKDFYLKMEGEDYTSVTMNTSVIESLDFSGGKVLQGKGSKSTNGDFRITYNISVPESGLYDITALTSKLGYKNTTNFFLYVNGNKTLTVAKASTNIKDQSFPVLTPDANAMRTILMNPVYLNQGQNEIAFVLDTTDTTPSSTYMFYIDYFEVKASESIEADGNILYTQTPEGEFADLSSEATKLSVFTNTWDLSLDFTLSTLAAKTQSVVFSVIDYYGKTIFTDNVSIECGKFNYKIDLGKHPTGYFTLKATLNNNELYKKVYIVTPDIQTRTIYQNSPFAMDFASYHTLDNANDSYMYASACKLMGISWVRERYESYAKWYEGQYDFSRSDIIYNNIHKCGLNISSIIMGSSRSGDLTMGELFAGKQLNAYKYVKDFTQRYKGIVDAVEIWNELDWQQHYSDTADIYASYYKAMVCAVLDANENTSKIFSALCQKPSENDWLEITAENDVFDFTDAFNYHYHIYDDIERPVTEFIDGTTAGELMNYANTYAPNMPAWCTEAGILLRFKNTPSEGIVRDDWILNSSQEKIQSNYMITSAVQSLAAGTDKHFWFIAVPNQENSGTFGSFRYDNSPYPSVAAEAIMTETLGSGSYIGEMTNLPDDTEGHIFNNGTDDVLVLWSEGNRTVALEIDETCLKVDIMGNKSLIPANNGKIYVNISNEPVYIVLDGKSPECIYKPTKLSPATQIQTKTDFTVGERVILTQIWDCNLADARINGYNVPAGGESVKINIANFNNTPVTGKITGVADGYTVTVDAGEITIPEYSEATVVVTVTPNPGNSENTFIRFNGIFNGSETSVSAAKIHLGS
ncbi:MAG: hypothetical protein DBX47_04685 [Clostridiales bacterium]|nr:MAG: hypothetical protein DBX47_04685 [Clostridiales bacterium]